MSDALPVPTLSVRDGVTLRPLRSDDAPEMFALIDANRAHLRAWLTWVDHHETSETVATFLAEVERKYEAGTGLELGLTVDGALAGCVGSIRSTGIIGRRRSRIGCRGPRRVGGW